MESSNRHSSRGHHKSKEEVIKINKSRKNMRTVALAMFWLAVLSMIFYIVIKFFPFLKSISFYKKINVSSITYILIRVAQILIPIVFVLPCDWYKQYIGKITLISYLYSIASFFLFFGMVADVFSYNLLGGYVDDGSNPILLKLLWNVTDKSGVVYCLIAGILYLLMSKKIAGHKKDVVIIQALTFVSICILPLLASIISGNILTDSWYLWFGKNIYIFISNLFMLIGFILSSTSRWVWGTVIWG